MGRKDVWVWQCSGVLRVSKASVDASDSERKTLWQLYTPFLGDSCRTDARRGNLNLVPYLSTLR